MSVPRWIGSRRSIVRMSVLLPDPDGPMMTTTSPSATLRWIPLRTWSGPYHLWTSWNSTIGMGGERTAGPYACASDGAARPLRRTRARRRWPGRRRRARARRIGGAGPRSRRRLLLGVGHQAPARDDLVSRCGRRKVFARGAAAGRRARSRLGGPARPARCDDDVGPRPRFADHERERQHRDEPAHRDGRYGARERDARRVGLLGDAARAC